MIHIHDAGAVRTAILDNRAQRNAIQSHEWSVLADAFAEFDGSGQRVLVVRGAQDDFCSGAALGGGDVPQGLAGSYDLMGRVDRAARALHETTKPTIAAVDGVAAGAGMNLALGCDLLVATTRARFAEIFVRRGLTLDFGGTWLLPRRVGLARAKDLALTGRVVDAAEAMEMGIVSRLVEPEALDTTVMGLADQLSSGAPLAQAFIKRGLDMSLGMAMDEALAYEAQTQAICINSEDAAEGVAAFVEKRPPQFKGR